MECIQFCPSSEPLKLLSGLLKSQQCMYISYIKFFNLFVNQIMPDMRELMDTMNRLSLLPADFEGKAKVSEW